VESWSSNDNIAGCVTTYLQVGEPFSGREGEATPVKIKCNGGKCCNFYSATCAVTSAPQTTIWTKHDLIKWNTHQLILGFGELPSHSNGEETKAKGCAGTCDQLGSILTPNIMLSSITTFTLLEETEQLQSENPQILFGF